MALMTTPTASTMATKNAGTTVMSGQMATPKTITVEATKMAGMMATIKGFMKAVTTDCTITKKTTRLYSEK